MSTARDAALTIAPLLRGLTFDGATGSHIRTQLADGATEEEATPERTGTLSTALPGEIAAALQWNNEEASRAAAHHLAGVLARYRDKEGTLPEAVQVSGIGTFHLGKTGTQPGASQHYAPENRNNVVKNRVAVVTGAAQGFGEEIARHLHAAGAFVVIADVNLEGARTLSDELAGTEGSPGALAASVDVTSEDSVKQMIQQVVLEVGGIDLFVSNAGVLKAGSVKELAAADFEFVTRVNYTGFFLCTKWASQVMALQNLAAGSYFSDIIQINSKSGLEGSNKNAAYAGGKFGGVGLVESFALELVADNIKVNAICPGNFLDGPLWSDPERGLFVQYLRAGKVPGAKTVADVRRAYEEKVPMGRGCTGRDVVRALFYVVEQRYETGQAVPVTGGQVMLR